MSFQTDALRTKSDQFHHHPTTQALTLFMLTTVAAIAGQLDPLKKAIFYGKPYIAGEIEQSMLKSIGQEAFQVLGNIDLTEHRDLYHAIIGKVTELAELVMPFLKHVVDGEALDKVNLAEEIGDDLWYDALALYALGEDMEEIQDKIIAKLRVRFPDKFTSEQALTRNLSKEREVLEG